MYNGDMTSERMHTLASLKRETGSTKEVNTLRKNHDPKKLCWHHGDAWRKLVV